MFTMQEFITEHKLGVSSRDPQAAQRIGAYLRKRGFSSRTITKDGKRSRMWSKDWPTEVNYADLETKLENLDLDVEEGVT